MATNPKATAEAMARPKAADLPRPLAAVRATVLRRVFSLTASTNLSTAFAYKQGCDDREHYIRRQYVYT